MKKRILSMILVLCMMITLAPVFSLADSSPKLIVSTETAAPGEEVTLTVTAENNPGVMALALGLDYDKEVLEYVGVEDGILTEWEVVSKAVWVGGSDVSENGVILKLKFKVLETAENGSTTVSLTCAEGDAANYNEENVSFEIVSGGVVVAHSHDYTEKVTEPTCTEQGYTTYTCACGESYIDNYVDALGHNYVDGVCTRCGEKLAIDIVTEPEDKEVHLGETAEFTVEAGGAGLTYRWQLSQDGGATWKNTSLDGYNTASLSVKALAYRDGYLCRCVVTDIDGVSRTTRAAKLTLTECEAKITKQPEDFSGSHRDTARFEIEAEGENLTYQWYFSTDGGTKWGKSSTTGSTSNVFEPTLYEAASGRMFRCEITDQYGMKINSDAVKMYVDYSGIEITKQPVSYTGRVNELVKFTVEASAVNLTYQWEFSTDGGETWKNSGNEGCTGETLNVRLYEYRDGYMYRCKLTSGSRYTEEYSNVAYTDAVTLSKIAKTVSIESQPENAYCEVGETAVFAVTASGNGLSYQWQYSKDGGESWANSGMTGAKTDTLNVGAISARNGQMYRCKVTDASGSYEISGKAVLHVGTRPVINTQPESAYCEVGETAVFAVEAEGEGLSYQWYYRTSETAGWAKSGQADATTATFTVAAKSYRNGYQYKCDITNESGMIVSSDIVTLNIVK